MATNLTPSPLIRVSQTLQAPKPSLEFAFESPEAMLEKAKAYKSLFGIVRVILNGNWQTEQGASVTLTDKECLYASQGSILCYLGIEPEGEPPSHLRGIPHQSFYILTY